MIGTTVSHYQIVEKLGQGGMGEVYLAEDTKLKRKVALKLLPAAYSSDPDSRARFQREAEALATLHHQHIVSVFEVSEHEGRPFIAMEYVKGVTLGNLVSAGDVAMDRIIDIAIQIAQGLQVAHKAEIVHRDIKSDNIVISTEGNVKIMDFGLATWRGVAKVTQEGSTVGTVAYTSPEQSQGRDADARSDLFSVGVVLYELIARKLPFRGEHEAAISYAIVHEEPHPLARYNAKVTPELQRIVSKCLQKDPDDRYPSADSMLSDLRLLKKESAISPVIPVATEKSRKPLIIGMAAVAIALVGIGMYAGGLFGNSSSAPADSDRKMVAVLPFKNLGAAEDDYFSEGMTDEITSRLATLAGLGVISRTSCMRYRNSDKSIPEIAEELGVSYVLEGSVRWDKSREPHRVRINPQLIRVTDDTHLWSKTYERSVDEIFAVQAEISIEIAEALNITLLEPDRRTLTQQPTRSIEAYEEYLKARSLFYTYDMVQNDLAIERFERVIARDPEFALAYAGLSLCYTQYWNSGWDLDSQWTVLAEEAARTAIELDPGASDAHFALGFIYESRSELDSMSLYMTQALERNVNHAHAHDSKADIYNIRGQLDSALIEYDASLTLDPFLLPAIWNKHSALLQLGRHRDARKLIERALEVSMGNPITSDLYGIQHHREGNLDSAAHWYAKAEGRTFSDPTGHYQSGIVYTEMGRLEEARAQVDSLTAYDSLRVYESHRLNLLALLALAEENYKQALLYADSAVSAEHEATEDAEYAKACLAEVYMQAGKLDSAVAAWQAVNDLPVGRLGHDFFWAKKHYKLGLTYEALNRPIDAQNEYRIFLDKWNSADDDLPEIVAAKHRLAELSQPIS